MRIGAGLFLIAVGAILRFGISTVSTHGVAVHAIGDILMVIGAHRQLLPGRIPALADRVRRDDLLDPSPDGLTGDQAGYLTAL